jgi:glycosyltransferase involved in cell wall biosynthesis
MNVLHLIDTTGPGGAETIFTELAHHSIELGYGSIALIRGDGWVKRRLAELGVETLIADCKGSFNLRFLRTLRDTIKARRIDLIHANLLGSNVYAALAGLLTQTPVIATFHGAVDIAARERLAWAKMGLVKTGAHVVAVSDNLRDELADHLRMTPDRISLIANAIDCARFAAARQHIHRTPDAEPFIIGALGNIRPAKAYDVALRTMAHLRAGGRRARLRIAGDPKEPLQSELVRLSHELDVSANVEFVGFVKDPAAYLASLDAFLLTSSSEGHPLAITQAMATALPIVATRCGVERILNNEQAWLEPVNDAAGLARAIQEVMDNPSLAAARGAAAQKRAFDLYDYAAMLCRYDELYARLTRRSAGRSVAAG